MLITKNNYEKNLKREEEKQKRLLEILQNQLRLTKTVYPIGSVGNSISSGYSKCDLMYPFLYRAKLDTIDQFDLYSYARVRKNEEQNIFSWYEKNISHEEINHLLLEDINERKDIYAHYGEMEERAYQTLAASQTIGMRDFVKLPHSVIIYNGLTGTFTNRLRRGNVKEKVQILNSFSQDALYLKAILLRMYLDHPGCQIYVCGIPDFLGLGLDKMANRFIKDAISAVPNAFFVQGSTRSMLTKLEEQKESDIHYNAPEYLALINRVLEALIDNLYTLPIKGEIAYALKEYSHSVEMEDSTSRGNTEDIKKIIDAYLEQYGDLIEDKDTLLHEIGNYYNQTYLVNYPCTHREEVLKVLKNR